MTRYYIPGCGRVIFDPEFPPFSVPMLPGTFIWVRRGHVGRHTPQDIVRGNLPDYTPHAYMTDQEIGAMVAEMGYEHS